MISVLFVSKKSVYKTMTDSSGQPLDCWDEERDAMKWLGGNPIVAHPPCRLWSMLSHFSVAPVTEKEFARQSIRWVREYGGVLEHPAHSKLWKEQQLPRPGQKDSHGFCLGVYQWWWGHRARKATWLYVCGIKPRDVPEMPFRIGRAEATWSTRHGGPGRIRDNEIEATPPAFARWLVETAERCQVSQPIRQPS